MIRTLKQFVTDESGATAIEYGLIAALVSVAAIGALTAMGGSLDGMFGSVSDTLCDALPEGTTVEACTDAAPAAE